MNRRQIQAANKIYYDWFGDDMDPEALKLAEEIEDTDDLEHHNEDFSAGQYDAIEAVLLKL